MEVAKFLVENWYMIVAALAIIAFVVVALVKFLHLPTKTQIANLKEWLKVAVTEAERELGSGTGQLKLRTVYEMAISKFPWVAQYVGFSQFSAWVDVALDWMRDQLENNKDIRQYVEDGTQIV